MSFLFNPGEENLKCFISLCKTSIRCSIERLQCTFYMYVLISSRSCLSHFFLTLFSDLWLLTLWPCNLCFSKTCERLTVVAHRNKRKFCVYKSIHVKLLLIIHDQNRRPDCRSFQLWSDYCRLAFCVNCNLTYLHSCHFRFKALWQSR